VAGTLLPAAPAGATVTVEAVVGEALPGAAPVVPEHTGPRG
jgi:hypothetical protein